MRSRVSKLQQAKSGTFFETWHNSAEDTGLCDEHSKDMATARQKYKLIACCTGVIHLATGDITKPISTLIMNLVVDHKLGSNWQIVRQPSTAHKHSTGAI